MWAGEGRAGRDRSPARFPALPGPGTVWRITPVSQGPGARSPTALRARGTPSGAVVGRRLPDRVAALLRPATARTGPCSPGLISAVGRDRPDPPRTGPRSCFGVGRHGTAGPLESRSVRGFTPGRHSVTRVGPRLARGTASRPNTARRLPPARTAYAAQRPPAELLAAAPWETDEGSRAALSLVHDRRRRRTAAAYSNAPQGTAEDPAGEPRRTWLARARKGCSAGRGVSAGQPREAMEAAGHTAAVAPGPGLP